MIVIAHRDMMNVIMTVTLGAMIVTVGIEVTEVVKGNSLGRVLTITVVVDRGTMRTDVETTEVTVEDGVEEKMTLVRDLVAVVMMTAGVLVDVEETEAEEGVVAKGGMLTCLKRGHPLRKVQSHFLKGNVKHPVGMWRPLDMSSILQYKLSKRVSY